MEDETRKRIADALRETGIAQENEESSPDITQNAQTVLERRYLIRNPDGSPAEEALDMFRRVAKNLSQADLNYGVNENNGENSGEEDPNARQETGRQETGRQETEDEFLDVMLHKDFIPNSPTLMNAGRELQQLSGCFVLPVDDSLDGIFDSVKKTALIHKSGGGTGFSFNNVRPQGDFVKSTGGIASGPASFIRAFDTATDVVKQGGTRRGANMGILNVDHPDILQFIRMKTQEGMLENFNISIAVTEDFMEQVQCGADYELTNPRTKEPAGTLNAREVFDEIVEHAWATGDPGLIFLDRINWENPNPHLGRIESTNPCVTGDTLVYTQDGMRTAREIHDEQSAPRVAVDSRMHGGHFNQATRIFSSGIRQVSRLRTQEGYEIRLTPEHRVMTNRGWVEAQELHEGDELHLLDQGGGFGPDGSPEMGQALEMGQTLGWLIGGGTLQSGMAVLSFCGRKRELAPAFAGRMNQLAPNGIRGNRRYTTRVVELDSLDESQVCSQRFLRIAAEYGLIPGRKHLAPERVMSGSRELQAGFLQGLFSADGHVNQLKNQGSRVHLTSISREMLIDMQRLLLNLGIASRIHFNRRPAGVKELPDGQGGSREYQTEAYHELVISGRNLDRFNDSIGFLDEFKQGLLREALESHTEAPCRETFTARFLELVPESEEEVFDLTESVTHSFVGNGIVVSNCGEQPLAPYESCNLGSVNLARMVRYTEQGAEVDWEKLKRVTRTGVHLLDNVIDMNEYPLPEIEAASRLSRRIGLGVMGWADLLIQLGIRYDSQEALKLASAIMKFIREETHGASTKLAEQRGAYPAWEGSTYQQQASPAPMRNTAPVTIAPTGTISIIAGASSGIEPLFALAYQRNIMDRTRMQELNPYFEAVARHEGIWTSELTDQVALTGSLRGTEAPDWMKQVFQVAQDISPEWHVRMQAAFQEHTDNSVSKTINFPNDATRDDVEEAYMLAYRTGCNGITVYRDGSKSEQVLSTGQTGRTRTNGQHPTPRPRPRQMEGVTSLVRTGHGNMYTTINSDPEGNPFEVFTTVGKAGGCDSAQIEAISRLISLNLRSDIDPEEIIRQLRGITCCPRWDDGVLVRSIPDGVALALENRLGYPREKSQNQALPDGQNRARMLTQPRLCPECSAPKSFQEGCETCTNPRCGWNLCN